MAPSSTAPLNNAGKAALMSSPILATYAQIGLVPILPQIEEHFQDVPGASALVRFLITAIGVSMVFGAPLAGLIANRLGWRPMLLGSLVLYGIVGMAGAIIDNLWVLVISRLLLGLATAVIGTLLMTIVTTAMEGDQRNKWLGYVMVAGMVAGLILMPLGGFLGSIGWRIPFLLYGMSFVMVALVALGIPEMRKPKPDAAAGGDMAGAPERSPFPFVILGISLVTGILCSAQTLYTPFHLKDIGITDPAIISMAMLPTAISGAIFSLAYSPIRRKFSVGTTFAVAFTIVGVGQALVGMSASFTGVVIGGIVTGIGIGLMTPNLYAFTATIGTEADRPRNMGLTRGLFFAGPFIAQFALEPIASMAQAAGALLALGVLGFVAAALFARLRPPAPAVTT